MTTTRHSASRVMASRASCRPCDQVHIHGVEPIGPVQGEQSDAGERRGQHDGSCRSAAPVLQSGDRGGAQRPQAGAAVRRRRPPGRCNTVWGETVPRLVHTAEGRWCRGRESRLSLRAAALRSVWERPEVQAGAKVRCVFSVGLEAGQSGGPLPPPREIWGFPAVGGPENTKRAHRWDWADCETTRLYFSHAQNREALRRLCHLLTPSPTDQRADLRRGGRARP